MTGRSDEVPALPDGPPARAPARPPLALAARWLAARQTAAWSGRPQRLEPLEWQFALRLLDAQRALARLHASAARLAARARGTAR